MNKERVATGQYRYWCQDSIGRLVICTFKDTDEKTGESNYWVTHYVNMKATTPTIKRMMNKLKTAEGAENSNGMEN